MNRAIRDKLSSKDDHILPHLISVYINMQGTLSSTEKSYVEDHLCDCQKCIDQYNSIYDEEISLDDRVIFRIVDNDISYKGDISKKGIKFKDTDFEFIVRQLEKNVLEAIPIKIPYAADNQKLKITLEGKEIYWRILNVVEGNKYKIITQDEHSLSGVKNLLIETVFRSNSEIELEFWRRPIFIAAALLTIAFALLLYFFILN